MFNIKKIILALVLILPASLCRAQSAGGFISGDFSVSSGAVFGTTDWDSASDIKVDSVTAGGPFVYVLANTYPNYYILRYSSAGVITSSVTLASTNGVNYLKLAIMPSTENVYALGSWWNNDTGRNEMLISRYSNDLVFTSSASFSDPANYLSPGDIVASNSGLFACFSTDKFSILPLSADLTAGTTYYDTEGSYSNCEKLSLDFASNVYVLAAVDGIKTLKKFTTGPIVVSSSVVVSTSNTGGNYFMSVEPVTQAVFLANSRQVCDPVTYMCDSWALDTLKYDNLLNSPFTATFINPGYGMLSGLAVDMHTNLAAAAFISNNGNLDYGAFILDTDDLSFKNSFFMDGGENDYPVSVAVDNSSHVYVTGQSDRYNGYSTNADVATVRFDAGSTLNRAPRLVWLSTTNYWNDGLNPEDGVVADTFTYKVRYQDPDGDAPQYVKVRIYRDEVEIADSPFVMTCEGADYRMGVSCVYVSTGMAGGHYSYQFVAMDDPGGDSLPADGYPTTDRRYGPQVGEGFIGNVNLAGGVTYSNGGWMEPKAMAVYTEGGKGDYVYGLANSNGKAFITKFSTGAGSVGISTAIYNDMDEYGHNVSDMLISPSGFIYTLDSKDTILNLRKYNKDLTFSASGPYDVGAYIQSGSMAMDSYDNIYAIGGINSDIGIVKFNTSLSQTATYLYGSYAPSSLPDYPGDVAVDSADYIFVTGYYNENGRNKMFLAKLKSDFTTISSATFSSPGNMSNDTANSVAIDANGNVFVLATANNGQNNNFLIWKSSNNLALLNTAMYDAGNMETAASIAIDTNTGNVYVTGTSNVQNSFYNTTNKMLALKFNSSLVFQSSFTYGGDYNESNAGAAAALNSAGQAYLFGYTDSWSYMNSVRRVRALKIPFADNKVSLSLAVTKKSDSSPLGDVNIALIPFNAKGSPDLSFMDIGKTNSSGNASFDVIKGVSYIVALSTPGYTPTFKDQVMDPFGSFNKTFLASASLPYKLTTMAAPQNTVKVNISNIYRGAFIMGEIYLTQTRERVSYGVLKATDTADTLEIYNVPNLAAGTYGIDVNIPGWLSTSLSPQTAVPSGSVFAVNMSSAMPPSSNYTQTTSTASVYFSGFVGDMQGNAISGAKIRVYNDCSQNPCDFSQEGLSDTNGRFSFSGLSIATDTLNMYINRAGYENFPQRGSIGPSNVMLPALNMNYYLQPATYTLTGVIKYLGNPLSYVKVRVNGKENGYFGYDSYGSTYTSSEWNNNYRSLRANIGDVTAYTDGDGMFTVPGLTDGNLLLQVENPVYRNINSGDDNIENTSDDLRITISSAGAAAPSYPPNNACAAGKKWVLDSSGTCKGIMPYVFDVGVGITTNAVITGNLVFTTTYTVSASNPLVIAKSSAVTVAAFEECGDNDCQNRRMFFKTIYGSLTSNTTSYTVYVSSDNDVTYWLTVLSNSWAKLNSFDNRISFEDTNIIIRNLNLTPSGRVTGLLKYPDGSTYKPGDNNWPRIELSGENVSFNEGGSINEAGTFEFANIPPGKYSLSIRIAVSTSNPYAPAEVDNIVVNAGKTTNVNVSLETGLFVQPQIFGLPVISTAAWSYHIIAVPSGQKMNQKYITELFFDNPAYSFDYSTATVPATWSKLVMPQGQYDFYLLIGSRYCTPDDSKCVAENYSQFANFMGKARNVAVKPDTENLNLGTVGQPIPVSILGSVGQTEISGWVKGANIFTDSDFARMFANFDSEIMPLIPALMVYDTAGELKGFSHVLPDATGIIGFESSIQSQDKEMMRDIIRNGNMRYSLWGLPPGKYTAVFANPNYPPVTKNITLPDESLYNFDFDLASISIGGLRGVVMSSTTPSMYLRNASVYVKGRITEKYLIADSSGAFVVENLPTGVYKLEIAMDGFVKTGKKVHLAKDDSLVLPVFYLEPSTSTIVGKVLLTKFPNPTTKEGIKVSAYDETLNITNPQSYLPTIEDLTDENGLFELKGVIPGHNYKVAVIETGKMTFSTVTLVSSGQNPMGDIVLPPQIMVKLRRNADSPRKVDVIINSPKELLSIPACAFNPGAVYDPSSASSLMLVAGPNNSFVGQFTTSISDRYYAVYVTVGDITKMEKTLIYDSVSNSKTEQYVQDISLVGGSAFMDQEKEEYSGIELDPGSLTQTSTEQVQLDDLVGGFFRTLPNVRTVKTDRGDITIAAAIEELMASEIYNIDLSNAQANKSFALTLKYDKEKVTNTNALKLYQYDTATGQWQEVPGTYSVDPMLGTVSVDVDSLESAFEGATGGATPLSRKAHKMSAISPKGYYVPSAASGSQTGQFAVFTANPATNTPAFSSSFEVYNMPNPFNLKSKNVVLSGDVGTSGIANPYPTAGTVIKYNLPAGKTGNLKFVIYNVAGEKVRTIDEGLRPENSVYYSEWDGKNDNGSNCASGVYFMLTYLDGKKLANKAHKMAIIK